MHDRFVRLPEAQRITGLSRAAIYAGMKNHAFPRSYTIGLRTVAWSAEELGEWVGRMKARRGA